MPFPLDVHSSNDLFIFFTLTRKVCGRRVLSLSVEFPLFIMFLFTILSPGAATKFGWFNLLTVAFVLAIDPKIISCLPLLFFYF